MEIPRQHLLRRKGAFNSSMAVSQAETVDCRHPPKQSKPPVQ